MAAARLKCCSRHLADAPHFHCFKTVLRPAPAALLWDNWTSIVPH
jgi:hypothetical protein